MVGFNLYTNRTLTFCYVTTLFILAYIFKQLFVKEFSATIYRMCLKFLDTFCLGFPYAWWDIYFVPIGRQFLVKRQLCSFLVLIFKKKISSTIFQQIVIADTWNLNRLLTGWAKECELQDILNSIDLFIQEQKRYIYNTTFTTLAYTTYLFNLTIIDKPY